MLYCLSIMNCHYLCFLLYLLISACVAKILALYYLAPLLYYF